jgi:hypothetical protein
VHRCILGSATATAGRVFATPAQGDPLQLYSYNVTSLIAPERASRPLDELQRLQRWKSPRIKIFRLGYFFLRFLKSIGVWIPYEFLGVLNVFHQFFV